MRIGDSARKDQSVGHKLALTATLEQQQTVVKLAAAAAAAASLDKDQGRCVPPRNTHYLAGAKGGKITTNGCKVDNRSSETIKN